jgi:glycosyltransferase involved in cell wall biosynthesis
MRILHVIPSLAARDGGPPKAVMEMCRELLRQGVIVEIYTTDADGPAVLRPVTTEGVRVTYFSATRNGYYRFSLGLALALKANLFQYDIAHIHALYQFSATVTAHYCRTLHVPYVLAPHGALNPYIYRRHRLRKWPYEVMFERRNLQAAAAVHFTTLEEMKLARSLGYHCCGAVVPLGIDFDDSTTQDDGHRDAAWAPFGDKNSFSFSVVSISRRVSIFSLRRSASFAAGGATSISLSPARTTTATAHRCADG